jgi:hypothetical protein
MPDNLQAFLQMLQARLRLIAFLVAAAMLGAIVYLKVSDTGPRLPPLPETPTAVVLEHKLEVGQAIAQEISRGEVPIEKSPLHNLITDDMFSSRAIQTNVQNEKRASDKVTEAERAKVGGNPQEAKRLIQEALAIYPRHLAALRMQKDLEGLPGNAAAEATTGTAPTVQPPAKAAPGPSGVVVPRVAPAPVVVPPTVAPAPAR